MMTKKKIKHNYREIGDMFLLDHILSTKDIHKILEEIGNIIATPKFLANLSLFIEKLVTEYSYPKNKIEKLKIILNVIKSKNKDLSNEVDECFRTLSKIKDFSDISYLDEFHMKKNNLESFRNNKYYFWNKEDIEESICFDYLVYMSFSVDKNKYNFHYLPKFILSKNYIYAIRKIIYVIPEIFKLEEFRKRVDQVINLNLELLDDYDTDTIKEFVKQNFNPTKRIKFNVKQLEDFKKEVELTKFQLSHLNTIPFNFSEFRNFYQLLVLEQYIYFGKSFDINSIDLEVIGLFIEKNVGKSLLTKRHKNKIIDILKEREDISKDEYEYCLSELDKIELLDNESLLTDHFCDRSNIIDKIKNMIMLLSKGDYSLLLELVNSRQYDLENFMAYMTDNEEFGQLKEHLKETNYPISILRFIKEYPSMFSDQSIYDRTMEVLNSYDDRYSKKAIKKLEKIVKR